jgi:hypothetical protein
MKRSLGEAYSCILSGQSRFFEFSGTLTTVIFLGDYPGIDWLRIKAGYLSRGARIVPRGRLSCELSVRAQRPLSGPLFGGFSIDCTEIASLQPCAPMIPDWAMNPPFAEIFGWAISYGPPVVLLVLGIYFFFAGRSQIRQLAGPAVGGASTSMRDFQEGEWELVYPKRRATRDLTEYMPDLRLSDDPFVINLFEGRERDKLFPLLEAEQISAWARPMSGGEPPLTRLSGSIWKTHYLVAMPKAQFDHTQTFLKTRARHETSYYDL